VDLIHAKTKQTFSDVIADLFVSTRTKQNFVVYEVIYDLLFN
jgi:predicted CopG family antitoxin